jgi:hypothetical protein
MTNTKQTPIGPRLIRTLRYTVPESGYLAIQVNAARPVNVYVLGEAAKRGYDGSGEIDSALASSTGKTLHRLTVQVEPQLHRECYVLIENESEVAVPIDAQVKTARDVAYALG